jgi:hypothetical protein
MPVTYVIDTQEKIIRTRCFGLVTFGEVADHFRALQHDPDCVGQLDVFLDLSETTSVPEARQIQAVPVEMIRVRGKVQFGACAIVATTDPLFGMLRMFGVLAERFFRVVEVFRTTAEAEAWLDSQRRQFSQN